MHPVKLITAIPLILLIIYFAYICHAFLFILQADICHAYHVVHNHGIPDERIIVMMYDDIANNPE